MTARRAAILGSGLLAVLLLALAGLWLARARLVEHFARDYFRQHGVDAMVDVGTLGLSGASGRFALGPAAAPELAAERIELFFDPLRWTPYLVEVRLRNPVVRARIDDQGRVTLPALQAWLDSLAHAQEKSPYVSDDLAVSFTGLRAFLTTPGGAVEVDGEAKLVKTRPVSAALTVRPGTLRWRDITARLENAVLDLKEAGRGYRLTARLAGDVAQGDRAVSGLDLTAEVPLLTLGEAVTADVLRLQGTARQLRGAGLTADAVRLTLEARDLRLAGGALGAAAATARVRAAALDGVVAVKAAVLDAGLRDVSASGRGVAGDGEVALQASVLLPDRLRRTIRDLPLLALDAPLGTAVADNLGPFALDAKARLARQGDVATLALTAPLTLRSAKGGLLRVAMLAAEQKNGVLSGRLQAAVSGGGLPPLSLASSRFTFGDQGLSAAVALEGKLDFAILKGIAAHLDGTLTAGADGFAFRLGHCEAVTLAALGPLATGVSAQACPAQAPLFALDRSGWRAEAEMRDGAAFLPLANARLRQAAARLSFDGKAGPRGTIAVSAAGMADAATPLRFKPVAGSGAITLADGVWRGRFAATDPQKRALGAVTFSHAMASGEGSAHVEVPLVFAQNGLQPEDLSPLLAALRKADGRADFTGDIAWSARGMGANTGTLTTRGFDFLTPMGRAHALDTTLALTSLLPPATAPGQALRIARIDWTLPFSAVDLRFGFSTQQVTVDRLGSDIAEGHVALAPFAIALAAPQAASTATVTGLSLAPLIAASNLSGKASLQGKVSGTIPFTAGPAGLRIANGRLTADGPGRLELSRSLWGDSAASANAVQDFAFQALESLAFESLTADVNSIDGGRLQIVFHVRGRSDPPRAQVAEVAVDDIISGSALQKPIPLPSGTPIELTLDASLNFDELLKSYAEAWSKALNGGDSH